MSMRRGVLGLAGAILATLALAPAAFGDTVYALVRLPGAGDGLEQFDSATPVAVSAPIPITGLQAGEVLVGIDFRPLTGQLLGASLQGRLYALNKATGVATQVGGPGTTFAPSGAEFGMDVNPVVDLIRLVSDVDQNLRLNPTTGAPVVDSPLAFAAGDPNFGANPNVSALGYSNNVVPAAATTAYGIDPVAGLLVTLGSPGGIPVSPNTGQLFTVGALGVATSPSVGLDISPAGTAYALLHPVAGVGSFYTINLANGAATLVGGIGGGATVADIAVQAGPTAVRMRSLSAVRTARGVVIRWWTAAAADTLGFNVFRERHGSRARLNRNLIVARSAVAGHRYSFVDRKPLRSGARYWVQAVAIDGSRNWFGPVAARSVR